MFLRRVLNNLYGSLRKKNLKNIFTQIFSHFSLLKLPGIPLLQDTQQGSPTHQAGVFSLQ